MAHQTLKQLAAPNLATQPPSITYPTLDRPLKLNSGFLNLLPKFNGLPGEDPYRHINEFIITCSTMQPDGIEEEQIKLRAFPFSLQGLHKAFLEKFFPASRIGSIRKDICGIKQLHQISEQLLVQYFYEGLMPQDRGMIDAASRGALVDKTLEQARNLIANMTQNTQQFGLRRFDLGKRMDECQSSMMEAQLANLTAMVSKLMTGGNAKASLCGICCLEGHTTDMCPTLQEGEANAVFPNQRRASSTDVNLGNLQAQVNNRLPSQPVANLRDNVSAITLRSGKELRSILKKVQNNDEENDTEVKKVRFSDRAEENLALPKADLQQSQVAPKEAGISHLQQPTTSCDTAPFPQRLRKEKSDDVNSEILETFRKISLGENVSAVFQKKLPIKCKDPGMFSIPCKIGDLKLDRAMLDLGASINVMPKSIYDKVQLGALKDTGLIIQLADRSNAYPDGVLEDVLVQVNELVFSADFYVLDMGPNANSIDVPLVLGRPFLKTARTKIDVHKGNLTMKFDGEIIKFNIFDAMRYPTDINFVFTLDVIDNFVQDVYELGDEDELKSILAKGIFDIDDHEFIVSVSLIDSVCTLDSPKLTRFKPILPNLTVIGMQVPSLILPPKLELKELPENLKYIYLGENQTLPLIVSNALTESQESKLLRVLKEHREAFGWTLADIKGLSMTLCTHKIALEPDSVPKRDP
ncbi:uncharacterized protein LOC105801055 [Gossypium raimondii]|uniref:uncharacterized protein LOC105801055 n=1 Tax=Gossypium raimondii TaxID=29730 RepID=UPI00063AF1EE|nr:uncharacterized protein LOC105801055 [Gossypium raimondii]